MDDIKTPISKGIARYRSPRLKSDKLAAYEAGLDSSNPFAAHAVTAEGGGTNQGRFVFYNHGAAQPTRCHKGQKGRKGGIAGTLAKENAQQVTFKELANGESKTYPRSEIKEISQAISTMPPIVGILKKSEIRDLVAYLASPKAPKEKPVAIKSSATGEMKDHSSLR